MAFERVFRSREAGPAPEAPRSGHPVHGCPCEARGRPGRSPFTVCLSLLCLAGISVALEVHAEETTRALLDSIRMVTISSGDPGRSARAYTRHMGYESVEEGTVEETLAQHWGAPNTTGRRYILLRSPDPEPVYLRFVESRLPRDYQPLTSAGWNALELLTRDPYALRSALRQSPFEELAGPAPLTEGSSIHAMQYRGPDGEVIYLTADLGDDSTSTLTRTNHPVGRPFIVVAAGEDLEQLSAFYTTRFALTEAFRLRLPVPFMARAQSLAPDHQFALTLLRLSAFSHSIELDEYPAAPVRDALPGELPPAIAVVTFCGLPPIPAPESSADPLVGSPARRETHRVSDKSAAAPLSSSSAPFSPSGLAYGGAATVVLRGAAGELIELVDCKTAADDESGTDSPLH